MIIKPKLYNKLEPEECSICMSTYTSILRKKVTCKYCKADTCSKCIERYLLDRHEDAHCLHCRVNYNDETLKEICTKTYLQHVYFKHRQDVLVNRERANLPGLQDAAINERQKRKDNESIRLLRQEINTIEQEINTITYEYGILYNEYHSKLTAKKNSSDIRKKMYDMVTKLEELRLETKTKRDAINRIRWPEAFGLPSNNIAKSEEEKKKFIRRCTRDGCQGFLSTAWKCGICDYYSCSKCFAIKTTKHDDPHECKKEDIETADIIKKDSKPCPNCGEFIMKTSGCFARNTPILLWNNSVKMSQDISIGDELVGDDGTKRIVLNTINGVDTMYEIRQSCGISFIVNSKHTLVLKYNSCLPINNDICNKLKRFEAGNLIYYIVVDEYIRLEKDIQDVLVGYKMNSEESAVSVSEIGLNEYFGWKVDGNSKFVLSDLTVAHNCNQMWCISCQTPWDWTTGKVVVGGIIHNPHYYEWMKRNGIAPARNPADIPCGGYPNVWQLRRMPRGLSNIIINKFFEFHRICMELQDISERTYRSHIDLDTTSKINIKFLLGDFDEKNWGQLLAKNERKIKRDREVQEVFAAFRMVAVELINRVQNYQSDTVRTFTELPVPVAEKIINDLCVEITALITMINDALRNVSISYSYSVPYIAIDGNFYSIKTKNFSNEVKKKAGVNKVENTVINSVTPSITPSISSSVTPSVIPSVTPSISSSVASSVTPSITPSISSSVTPSVIPSVNTNYTINLEEDDIELQLAIADSLTK